MFHVFETVILNTSKVSVEVSRCDLTYFTKLRLVETHDTFDIRQSFNHKRDKIVLTTISRYDSLFIYLVFIFCLVFCLLIILFSVHIIMKNWDLIKLFKHHTFLDMLAQMIIICFVFWTLDNNPFTLLYHPYLSYFSYLFIFDFQVIFLFK